uniref:Putative ribosomal RNA adenine dimethylase n=1 Tax=uncultured marine microorganism HF4000_010I05 TaxID=455517 RepID=B3T1I1_9ZZZZ|nr:putative ribosomal RNA adenine dimethylase [uncultured marine microorganism HF4000_010I05]
MLNGLRRRVVRGLVTNHFPANTIDRDPVITSAAPRIRPRKSLGQHFLADGRVLTRIVNAAEIASQELVLEIGPGQGALTRRLVDRGAQVVAIELDHHLASTLPDRLGNPPNLTVVEADARKVDLKSLLGSGAVYKVLGNLPYYAANPIIRRFLEAPNQPQLMVVTLQQEVARSMAAAPGKMGFLSVAVQYYAETKVVCTVPPRAFRPPPKVTSAVVRLDIRPVPPVDVAEVEAFFALVRAGFASPRKQLRNSLAHGLGVSTVAIAHLLDSLNLDGSRRPATLSMVEWAVIHSAWERREKVGNPGLCQTESHP